MSVTFAKATKKQSRARVALNGPSGSGKTFTGLVVVCGLAGGGKVAVIDSERGSASKYAHKFDFDVCELTHFSPQAYIDAIKSAEDEEYVAILIDSLTHAWSGVGGALEMVDNAVARSRSNNSYTAWREVTPVHNRLVDTMLQSPCHIVATMRTKTEYALEDDGKGKKVPKKIGMAPIQRDGMEYEFDITGDLDLNHRLIISKTRCEHLDQAVIEKPDASFAKIILDWVTDGVAKTATPTPKATTKPAAAKKPGSIADAATPDKMVATLKKWMQQAPVGTDVGKWEGHYRAATSAATERTASQDWPDWNADTTGELMDVLVNVASQIDTCKQAEEVI